jgi:UDP-N-acetylmuramyl pentapeptide phosphotransferase/UDP-N-acetylglucosamine-1-phosphate transferase
LSLALSFFLVITKKFHGRFTFDKSVGIQSFHTDPTPRIGGIALFVGFLIVTWWGPGLSATLKQQVVWPVILASIPAFLFGLAEDVTRRVGTTSRLIATMASALIAWWLMGVSLRELDVAILDQVLALTAVSVIFTVFAVGGIANAINIIDGFHGLASGVSIILFAALGAIAYQVGDFQLAVLCGVMIALLAGFLVINFPFGKLFLGDGGAYFIGFMLGWVCVLLPARNPEVSPWACLLVCAYPVTETIYSIFRRAKTRLSIDQPDREHLHSLFKQVVIVPFIGTWPPNLRNAAVSPMLWVLAAIPATLAVIEYSSALSLALVFVLFFGFYVVLYASIASRRPSDAARP